MVAAVCALLALLALIWSVRQMLLGISSNGWPGVPGTILKSKFSEVDPGGSASADEDDDRGDRSYQNKVSYSYNFKAREYTGSRIRFPDSAGGFFQALFLALRYKPGCAVKVHVNPADPRVSVLEPGVSLTCVGYVLLSMVFLLVSLSALRGD